MSYSKRPKSHIDWLLACNIDRSRDLIGRRKKLIEKVQRQQQQQHIHHHHHYHQKQTIERGSEQVDSIIEQSSQTVRLSTMMINTNKNDIGTSLRTQATEQVHKLNKSHSERGRRRKSLPLNGLLIFCAGFALMIALVGANYATNDNNNNNNNNNKNSPIDAEQLQQHQHQQAQANYGQQQQHQHLPTKAKKIQIVYIKVPLAKLKPTLPNGSSQYPSAGSSSSENGNSTVYSNGQVKGSNNATDALNTKTQGSQASASDEQQLKRQQQQQQQASTFLIPMAVVQEQPISPSASINMAAFNENIEPSANVDIGRLTDQQGPNSNGQNPMLANGPSANNQNTNQLGFDQSQQQNQNLYRAQMLQSNSVWPEMAAAFGQGPEKLAQQNGLALPRKSRANPDKGQQWGPMGNPLGQGFMSAFLSAEKEKLNSAAAMIMNHQQQPNQQNQNQHQQQQPQSNQIPTPSSTNQQTQTINQQQNEQPFDQLNQRKPSGGLMPVVMAPFSHMPDNMIGQAYNAAVRQALPMDTGLSTNNLLGSSSVLESVSKHGRDTSAISLGGKSGINGDAGSSSPTISGASYGANGQSQSEAISGVNGFHTSGSGYANSGPSSGYGNGINTFGASVAFSDFPTGSGQAPVIYGQHHQQQQSTSASNSNSNIHQSNQLQQADQYNQQGRLKQAKKTIIPIVVQVEHAVVENNDIYGRQKQANGANKYGGQQQQQQQQQQQPSRPFAGFKRAKQQQAPTKGRENYGQNNNNGPTNNINNNQIPYGASSNEIGLSALLGNANAGAQYVNAANAQDINQITAAINAENAASAAAALAQADMAFGNGSPAYMGSNIGAVQQHQPRHPHQQQSHRPNSAINQYAHGLQSAASALLANTHPMIQAAASNGIGSVSKLGAKLGEMMALPSMQVPNVINSLSSSLPNAFSSLSSQMGAQLNQAVQQVAKEHPAAHAYVRQVAQSAGLSLPQFSAHQQGNIQQSSAPNGHQMSQGSSLQQMASQMIAGASQLSPQTIVSSLTSGPQSQLQNLKLSIGQNLQSAAAQLVAGSQKNPTAMNLLANSPLSALYPASVNAAIKQLSSGMLGGGDPNAQAASMAGQNQALNMDPHHAQSSSIVPVVQGDAGQISEQSLKQQQQLFSDQLQSALMGVSGADFLGGIQQAGKQAGSSQAGPVKSSTFKSKFLSFFQPPKFISNLLSWNDRADERNDQGSTSTTLADGQKLSTTLNSSVTPAPTMTTVSASASASASTSQTSSATATSNATTSVASSTSPVSQSSTSVAPSTSEPMKTTPEAKAKVLSASSAKV